VSAFRWWKPRYEVQQFSAVSGRRLPLGKEFVYRSRIEALRAAVRYQAIARNSDFRVFDQKTGEYVA
jgi:hypothetical protein